MAGNVISIDDVKKALKLKYGHVISEVWYAPLEYIECTGTQWIDAEFIPDNNSRMVVDFAATDASTTNNIIGSRNTTTAKAFTFSIGSDAAWRMGYNGSSPSTSIAADTLRHTADYNKNVLSLDGNVIYTASAAEFTGYASIYIGAIHASGSGYNGLARFYGCRIYDNDVLVRDYVPVVSQSGEAGLFDCVGNIFYPNAGTGVFVIGPERENAEYFGLKTPYKIKAGHVIDFDEAGSKIAKKIFGGSIEVTYTGTHTVTQITGTDGALYNLYALTGSGTLTVSDTVQAWICGGGGGGGSYNGTSGSTNRYGGGAGGGYVSGTQELNSGTYVITIGTGGSADGNGGTSYIKQNGINLHSAAGGDKGTVNGGSGGSGGGGAGRTLSGSNSSKGTGAGKSTYPFGITSLKAHSAGGSGGEAGYISDDEQVYVRGGKGGSNGGAGAAGGRTEYTTSAATAGGSYGGGKGGKNDYGPDQYGGDATFYGSGGGGAAMTGYPRGGGAGYQGVAYILIPA